MNDESKYARADDETAFSKDLNEWLREAVASGRYTGTDNAPGVARGVVTGWTIWVDILEPDGNWAWHREGAPGQVPTLSLGHAHAIQQGFSMADAAEE